MRNFLNLCNSPAFPKTNNENGMNLRTHIATCIMAHVSTSKDFETIDGRADYAVTCAEALIRRLMRPAEE